MMEPPRRWKKTFGARYKTFAVAERGGGDGGEATPRVGLGGNPRHDLQASTSTPSHSSELCKAEQCTVPTTSNSASPTRPAANQRTPRGQSHSNLMSRTCSPPKVQKKHSSHRSHHQGPTSPKLSPGKSHHSSREFRSRKPLNSSAHSNQKTYIPRPTRDRSPSRQDVAEEKETGNIFIPRVVRLGQTSPGMRPSIASNTNSNANTATTTPVKTSPQPTSSSIRSERISNGAVMSWARKEEPIPFPNCCENADTSSASSVEEELGEAEISELLQGYHGPKFIDTHCHLDFLFASNKLNWKSSFEDFRRTKLHGKYFGPSYGGCVMDMCRPETWVETLGGEIWPWKEAVAEQGIWTALGCHPHFADKWSPAVEKELRIHLTNNPKVVAVGECGLDFSGRNLVSHQCQIAAFEAQAALAREMRKPLVIHVRGKKQNEDEVESRAISLLQRVLGEDAATLPIHRHCFQGSMETASQWIEAFPYVRFGINPNISSIPRAKVMIKALTLDRILLETDAPYFLPTALRRGNFRHSSPAFALVAAKEIQMIRPQLSLSTILDHVARNVHNVYGIAPV